MSLSIESNRDVSMPPGCGAVAVWIVFGVLAALLLSYLGLLIARPASESSTLIDGWGVAAFNITAAGLCIARGLTRRTGRLVPLVLGASLLAWGLGDLALTIESLGGADPVDAFGRRRLLPRLLPAGLRRQSCCSCAARSGA